MDAIFSKTLAIRNQTLKNLFFDSYKLTEEQNDFITSCKTSMKDLDELKCNYIGYYSAYLQNDINKIRFLKHDINANFLEIGKILKMHQERDKKRDYKFLLAHPMVDIKRTQAQKMIGAYKYIAEKKIDQLTGIHVRLGIEKLYLISTVKNKEFCEKLENFALKKEITVKKLKLIVKNLNNNETTLEEAYNKVLQEIKAKKNNKKTFSQAEIIELQEKNKKLEAKIFELESRLKEFEKNNENTNSFSKVVSFSSKMNQLSKEQLEENIVQIESVATNADKDKVKASE